MAVKFDATTDQMIADATPGAIIAHRTAVTAADGTTKPAANNANWAANPGGRTKCRVWVTMTGTTPTATIVPYLRSGGTSGQVGGAASQTLNGTPNFDAFFDVQTDGDDVLIWFQAMGGTTPSANVFLSWRQ